jgi:hypothetical protein
MLVTIPPVGMLAGAILVIYGVNGISKEIDFCSMVKNPIQKGIL